MASAGEADFFEAAKFSSSTVWVLQMLDGSLEPDSCQLHDVFRHLLEIGEADVVEAEQVLDEGHHLIREEVKSSFTLQANYN